MFLIHHLKMKTWVLFCVIACIAEVSSMFLSLLYHLKMNNPVIVGKINDLKNKDMIQLFKDVNGLDQSICMITVLKNDSLQRSSGIIVHPDNLTLDKFYVQKVKKFMKILIPSSFGKLAMVSHDFDLGLQPLENL